MLVRACTPSFGGDVDEAPAGYVVSACDGRELDGDPVSIRGDAGCLRL